MLMSLFLRVASSELRYDHSTLLEIKASINFVDGHFIAAGPTFTFSSYLLSIPLELSRLHCGSYFKKKHHKGRGKRGRRLARSARVDWGNYELFLWTWLLPVYPDQPAPIFQPLLLKTHKQRTI